MDRAIICNKKHRYQNIKSNFLKNEKVHYYPTVDDFKESEMIPYRELIVYDYVLNALDLKSVFDLQKYCADRSIKVFKYVDEEGQSYPIDFDEIIEENSQNSRRDTVEMKVQEENSGHIEIIKTVYKNIPQKNIGVVSLSEKAGSTFISLNLVKELSQSNMTVSYIEMPFKAPHAFEQLGLFYKLEEYDKKVDEVLFIEDLLEENAFNNLNKSLLQDQNITWLTMHPSISRLSTEETSLSELIHRCRFSSVNIMDVGKVKDINDLSKMMYKMDHLLLIIDPLPWEIARNEAMLKALKETLNKRNHLIMLVNKFHKEVHMKELREYLDFSPIITVSHIDIGYIYKAIYNLKVPIEIKECSKGLSEDMKKITELIVPKDILVKKSKGSRMLEKVRGVRS